MEQLKLAHIVMYIISVVHACEGYGTSSLLVMITLCLNMYTHYIGNSIPWINSLNLRWSRITYWVNISRHFNQIEVVSSRFDYFLRKYGIISHLCALGTPLQNRVYERRNQTLIDTLRSIIGFSSLPIFFQGCLRDYIITSLLKRYISLQDIQEDFRGLLLCSQYN